MIPLWTISTVQRFRDEYSSKERSIQEALELRLEHLARIKPNEWKSSQLVKALKGEKCKGLIEVRFKALDVQQRPIGFYGPGKMEFTLLLWAYHKGQKYVPKNFCKSARDLCLKIADGSEATHEWTIED